MGEMKANIIYRLCIYKIDLFVETYNTTYDIFCRDQVSLFKSFNIESGNRNKHIIFNNVLVFDVYL